MSLPEWLQKPGILLNTAYQAGSQAPSGSERAVQRMTARERQDQYDLLETGFKAGGDFEVPGESYEGARNWIINDGGEVREDKAFKDDGETVKKGWLRLYYK